MCGKKSFGSCRRGGSAMLNIFAELFPLADLADAEETWLSADTATRITPPPMLHRVRQLATSVLSSPCSTP